jgi:hypothetical protein
VEVARRIGLKVSSLWYAFPNAVGGFIEELAFRVMLAFKVLTGRVPLRTEKRTWSKVVEAPVLVDVYDWTDDRRIFSVLVWPPMETESPGAYSLHQERVEEVISAISSGAADRAWCTRWEVDHGLRWDHKRQVWVAEDNFAYALPEVRTTREAEGAA